MNRERDMYFIPIKMAGFSPRSRILFQSIKKPRKKNCVFLGTMYPLMMLWRLIGRFPFTLNGRDLEFKFCGYWMFHTVIVLLLNLYLQILSLFLEDGSALNDKLVIGISFIVNCLQLLSSLFVWFEVPMLKTFFKKWNDYEDALDDGGLRLESGLKKWTITGTVVNIPLSLAMSIADSYVYNEMSFVPIKLILYCNISSTLIVWLLMTLFIMESAGSLQTHLNKVFFRADVKRKDVVACRKLWLMLSDLISILGCSLGPNFLVFLVMSTIICISSVYGTIFVTHDGLRIHSKSYIMILLTLFLFTLFIFMFFCELGQRISNKAGSQFTQAIVEQDFSKFDQQTELELNVFLRTIKEKYPHLALCGYVTINRNLFLSFLSASVTYLIVLVQFRIGRDNEFMIYQNVSAS